MAFLWANIDTKERFSLLLLEPGEIYFQDFGATLYSLDCTEDEALRCCQKGRLKICSKSVVFDPKDVRYPLLKISYSEIEVMNQWCGSLFSKLGANGKSLVVDAKLVVEMKCNNTVSPYEFKRERQRFLFSLSHSCVNDCLPYMSQLHRASMLPHAEQNSMIAAIVLSRQCRQKFDTSRLDDLYETIVKEVIADHITPLVTNPGRLMLTSSRLYFQPFNNATMLLKIRLCDIRRVIRRRFLLHNQALEIYCTENVKVSSPHLYVFFKSPADRSDFYQLLLQQKEVKLDDPGQENMTLRWQNRIITNFEYLEYLNSAADRSINDLTQYPVYPWIISDYTSQSLDLTDERSYRDLSKPIGALSEERLERLQERFDEMPEPKFLYGSHYSSPAHVLFFLARAAPQYMLCLHGGKFDHPNRIFNSVAQTFNNCLTSMSDFKELIPEFYESNGEFLQNIHRINFGTRQDGQAVNDVELPPWAKTTQEFVSKLREALEAEYVSQHLHEWIDLIFGYKQRGKEAVLANNVFVHTTYEGAVNLDSIKDANERLAVETQIMEFGQTPKQLFVCAHPQRCVATHSITSENDIFTNSVELTVSNAADSENNSLSASQLTAFSHFRKHTLHRQPVLDVRWSLDKQSVLSSSQDGTLKLYSVCEDKQLHSCSPSSMPISSVVFMPEAKTVAAGSWDNNIYVYSLEYGRTVNTSLAHDDAISQLSVCENLLVSSSWDSTVKLWRHGVNVRDVILLDILAELEHDTGVNCVCQNTDNSQVVSGTRDGQVYVWDANSLQILSRRQAHLQAVSAVCFSPDNRKLVSCGNDGFLKIFDVTTGSEVFAKNSSSPLKCAVWADKYIIAGCDDGCLVICDSVLGQVVHQFPAHDGAVTCIDLLMNKTLCSGGTDRTVHLWSWVS